VTIDIGDPKDVYPHNKAPLGKRLTRMAMANVYGRKLGPSGQCHESPLSVNWAGAGEHYGVREDRRWSPSTFG
jgi:hypothetical protein